MMTDAQRYPTEFGRYRLLRKIAQGGMAEIFLAQNAKAEICAIKRILPHLAHEESFIRMFIDEARIVSHLDHPNIAQVYDQGKEDGFYFIAMEFVQGHSLLALSERAKSLRIPLPLGLLAFVVAEFLAGLGCAHVAKDGKGRHLGIVHRDVTPQNVLVSYDGVVKLIDFGVAKAKARLTQTEAGFTKGKLSYMSPEQARGEELDSRSDLFSVGIVLFEITTGSRLFNKEGPGGILGAIVNDPIPTPSMKVREYPRDLEWIVMRALEKDKEKRWQSAEEMRDALLRFARKEKPRPGQSRLRDLVHDLFGAPEDQKVIEAAQALVAPTSAEISVHRVVENAPLRVGGTEVPDVTDADGADGVQDELSRSDGSMASRPRSKIKDDETRMMMPASSVVPLGVARRREVTNVGTPIVSLPIPQDDAPVPDPHVPFRVRAAHVLARLSDNVRARWRAHRHRYIAGIVAASLLFATTIAHLAGGTVLLMRFFGVAIDRAREVKQSAGLDRIAVDAGSTPTVLRLSTNPPGATILINGIGAGGVTPQDLDTLELGRPLSIELTLPGYRSRTEKLTLFENQGLRELSVKLDRQLGTLVILSDPPGAKITFNGKPREGETPMRVENLPTGATVQITAAKFGRISKSTVAVVGDADERQVKLTLPVDQATIPPGLLDVATTPSGCAVWVDEGAIGRSPVKEHKLRPGAHSVRVLCDNHAEETRAVTIGPERVVSLAFSPTANVFGYLTIQPVPAEGSQVFIGGQRIALPVEFLKVVPGRQEVMVVNEGLRRKKELSIEVSPNARVTRRVDLFQ